MSFLPGYPSSGNPFSPPPLQGEGQGGDGVHACNGCIGTTINPTIPLMERGLSFNQFSILDSALHTVTATAG